MNASLTIQPARRISTRQALRAAPPRPVYQAPDRARRQRAARRRHRIAAAALLALLALFGGLRAAALLLPSGADATTPPHGTQPASSPQAPPRDRRNRPCWRCPP